MRAAPQPAWRPVDRAVGTGVARAIGDTARWFATVVSAYDRAASVESAPPTGCRRIGCRCPYVRLRQAHSAGPKRTLSDRKSVVSGQSVSVRVYLGGRGIIQKKKT